MNPLELVVQIIGVKPLIKFTFETPNSVIANNQNNVSHCLQYVYVNSCLRLERSGQPDPRHPGTVC